VTFKIGDRLVYPNYGVGVVETVQESLLGGSPAPWYELRFLGNNSRVMVPVGNADRIGLRLLTRRTDVGSVFRALENATLPPSDDGKGRHKQNLDRMRSGHLADIADVLRNLAFAQKQKALSSQEKKMYEHARNLIVSEIAQINGLPESEVAAKVEEALDCAITNRHPVAVAFGNQPGPLIPASAP
jgi:CarD family transcriptional regulator